MVFVRPPVLEDVSMLQAVADILHAVCDKAAHDSQALERGSMSLNVSATQQAEHWVA